MPREGQATHKWHEKNALRMSKGAIELSRQAPARVHIFLPLFLFTVAGVLNTAVNMRIVTVVHSHTYEKEKLAHAHVEVVAGADTHLRLHSHTYTHTQKDKRTCKSFETVVRTEKICRRRTYA